jgi:hypothetical protein
VVGLVADASSLRLGLLLVPAAGLVVVALASTLQPRSHPDQRGRLAGQLTSQ